MWQPIDNQTADEFVRQYGQSELLQSANWLDLQQQFYQVERLGYYHQQKLVAVAGLIRRRLIGRYAYYYSPRGPIWADDQLSSNWWPQMLADIKPWLVARQAIFWRIEPNCQPTGVDLNKLGLIHGPDIQPSQTRILDISQTEEALLQQMHPKTRYNIRLATKRGVVIEAVGPDGFTDFWRLMAITGQRNRFHLHQPQYYRAIIKAPFSQLLVAKWQGQILAAGIFTYWGRRAVYLHGASDNKQRQLMAPYLIQWQAILTARQRGCQTYDFFGINQQKWPGVTRFKQGFGGKIVNYPGTFDWPINQYFYRFYQLIRQLRRLLR
ncbi:MAG TPA: peptidoglycan bridge formation glycyltransferase FemA/FemB family protein [bacterium]|jgi:lipid II:glycine glycyltransferase (peptidoglycan interpeptide bridge formation enzyme)|nr:peptidoglycan bridge formation glycyltransferase FemA/FemB family protein [bacterium]HNZ51693.1 peptidoglycan bridge formation glycyltransferase FemA/FemB family protein [bacterium]HOF79486.1 peptidoglycan bridge formation glycyltransferase FemA/FemB family protein [bacterium]HOQ91965.1 peptidoglycan bridge formation glycyltransferase FemA/FemB family protein [bacterium]HPW44333.1 peptidoglycan bridge formation glycyltransferase FemA/FemB family protein [bacterium]